MKIPVLLLLFALTLLTACEKDQITRDDITGTWILQTRYIDTLYANGKDKDTTISEGKAEYIINNSDTLTVCSVSTEYCTEYWMNYQPPNTLTYNNCPIGWECLLNVSIVYKILKAVQQEMIWKREIKYPDQMKLIEILYFTKLD
jgi:hypothetical protein